MVQSTAQEHAHEFYSEVLRLSEHLMNSAVDNFFSQFNLHNFWRIYE